MSPATFSIAAGSMSRISFALGVLFHLWSMLLTRFTLPPSWSMVTSNGTLMREEIFSRFRWNRFRFERCGFITRIPPKLFSTVKFGGAM